MSIERTKGGEPLLRVQVRTSDDGCTRSAVQLGEKGAPWLVLVAIPTEAYQASTDVQAAFIALTQAVVAQLVAEALPGTTVERATIVPPGGSLDEKLH